MKRVCCFLSLAVGIGLTAPLWAQDIDTAQKRLLSHRAAQADAYRKLAEAIKGLQISSTTYVKDFVAESDTIRGQMDTFIRGVRLGQPTFHEDLSCEVPAEVTVAKVIETLKEIHTRDYKGDRIKGSDFEQMNQRTDKQIIKVVGMGAPRPDLPPNLPAGVESVLVPPPSSLPEPSLPALWARIPSNERLMAQRAARLDAMRQLIERIRGLRVNSNTIVRDFVAEHDDINAQAQGMLIGANEVRTYYHHDEPIVEVTMEVPLETVLTQVKEMHARAIKGDNIRGTDTSEVSKSIKSKTFQATGMGIPRPQALKQYNAAVPEREQIPPWAMMPIRMEGRAAAPPDKAGTAQGKLLAARAAELDARRKLGEHIQGLQVSSNTLVRDFMSRHDEIRSQVDAHLAGAIVEQTQFDGDEARVTVSVPGMQVWEMVSQRMRFGN